MKQKQSTFLLNTALFRSAIYSEITESFEKVQEKSRSQVRRENMLKDKARRKNRVH